MITIGPVRCGKSPDILVVGSILIAIVNTELTVGERGVDRALEVVIPESIAPAAEVYPCLAELVREERPLGERRIAGVCPLRPGPGLPAVNRDRMCRRADSEQIQQHKLAVYIPTLGQKAVLRLPAVAKQSSSRSLPAIREHRLEIDLSVDLVGQVLKLGAFEVLTSEEPQPGARLYQWTTLLNPTFAVRYGGL